MLVLGVYAFTLEGGNSLAIHGTYKVRIVSDSVATALGPPQRPLKALASSLILDSVENV